MTMGCKLRKSAMTCSALAETRACNAIDNVVRDTPVVDANAVIVVPAFRMAALISSGFMSGI